MRVKEVRGLAKDPWIANVLTQMRDDLAETANRAKRSRVRFGTSRDASLILYNQSTVPQYVSGVSPTHFSSYNYDMPITVKRSKYRKDKKTMAVRQQNHH